MSAGCESLRTYFSFGLRDRSDLCLPTIWISVTFSRSRAARLRVSLSFDSEIETDRAAASHIADLH